MIRPLFLNGLISGLSFVNRSSLVTNSAPEVEPPARADIVTLDPDGTDPTTEAPLAHASRAGDCAMGDDGTLLSIACQHNDRIYYHRATQAGGAFMTDEVMAGAQTPIAVGKSKPRGDASPQVGVALRDASGNLWFFVRDAEGAEVLAPAGVLFLRRALLYSPPVAGW